MAFIKLDFGMVHIWLTILVTRRCGFLPHVLVYRKLVR